MTITLSELEGATKEHLAKKHTKAELAELVIEALSTIGDVVSERNRLRGELNSQADRIHDHACDHEKQEHKNERLAVLIEAHLRTQWGVPVEPEGDWFKGTFVDTHEDQLNPTVRFLRYLHAMVTT